MKVIFLDIDGVMNSELYARKRYAQRWLRIETYKWWITAKVRYVLNGFKTKGYSLKDVKLSKKFYTFEYKFSSLKRQTDPLAWKFLINLIEETGAYICVSSVWRHHFNDIFEWNRAFVKLGFKDGVCVGTTGLRRTLRGDEIKDWIDNSPSLSKYAILDDDGDMLIEQMPFFFHVDGYCGLSPNVCYRIKNLFQDTK
jgi:hypothetical protein